MPTSANSACSLAFISIIKVNQVIEHQGGKKHFSNKETGTSEKQDAVIITPFTLRNSIRLTIITKGIKLFNDSLNYRNGSGYHN